MHLYDDNIGEDYVPGFSRVRSHDQFLRSIDVQAEAHKSVEDQETYLRERDQISLHDVL